MRFIKRGWSDLFWGGGLLVMCYLLENVVTEKFPQYFPEAAKLISDNPFMLSLILLVFFLFYRLWYVRGFYHKELEAFTKPAPDTRIMAAIEFLRETKKECSNMSDWQIAERIFNMANLRQITIWGCRYDYAPDSFMGRMMSGMGMNRIEIPYQVFESFMHRQDANHEYIVENHGLGRIGISPYWTRICIKKEQLCHAENI